MQRHALCGVLLCLALLAGVMSGPLQAGAQQPVGQWKGLVAGRSNQDEVYVALGRPAKTRTAGDLTLLFWPPSLPPGQAATVDNMVALRQGVVQYMLVADPAELESDPQKIVAKLGKPQGVTRSGYSANSSYYHYPLRGVSFLVDSGPAQHQDKVIHKMVYAPTDWAALQATFNWARPNKPRE